MRGVDGDDAPDCKHFNRIYKVHREYLKRETDLINSRLTWILSISGFLFAAYGLTLQAVYGKFPDSDAGDFWNSPEVFLKLIAFAGIVTSCAGALSILAARMASNRIVVLYIKNIELMGNVKITKIYSETAPSKKKKRYCIFNLIEKHLPRLTSTYVYRELAGKMPIHACEVSGKSIYYIPHIRGGGSRTASILGFVASESIPVLLALVWVITLFMHWSVQSPTLRRGQNDADIIEAVQWQAVGRHKGLAGDEEFGGTDFETRCTAFRTYAKPKRVCLFMG